MRERVSETVLVSAFRLPSGRVILLDRLKQRQDALLDQIYDLWAVGMRLGMHDAADWLKARIPRENHRGAVQALPQEPSNT